MPIDEILRNHLTGEQYEVVTNNSREVLCLACAGSGKSRTLAFRIARLVAEGESPEGIVAFTFTEKAADVIKRRVAWALTESGLNPAILGAMYIGTIHSYCKFVLGEMDARYRQYEVLDENRLRLFLISRFYELGLQNLRTARGVGYFETIREVGNAWNVLNDELLEIADVRREDPVLGDVLQMVFDRLGRDQFLDFSLMIRLAVEAMQRNDARVENVISKIRHLLVDEYQDVNPVQEGLIANIHRNGTSLFVVGDDDQAIYAWRGADVQNILTFQTRYYGCFVRSLSTNFRSSEAIVSCSSLFAQNQLGPRRIPKNPAPDTNNLTRPRHFGKHWFADRQEEAAWVAGRINYLLGKTYQELDGQIRGLCPSDFAILMPSTNTIEQDGSEKHVFYTRALEALGIRYSIEAQGSIFNFPAARVLRETFELLREQGLYRDTLRTHFDRIIIPVFPNADFEEVSRLMSKWSRLIHEPYTGPRRKVSPQQLLHEMLNAFHIYDTPFDETQMQAIGIFSRIMQDVESVYVSIDSRSRFHEILNFLNHLAAEGYETSPDEVIQRPNAVFVSTIHGAKGLEFPVVFVVDVEQGRIPGINRRYNGWFPQGLLRNALNRGAYINTRESDIRVFYTAITRAERYLYVTGSERLPGGIQRRRHSVFEQALQHPEIILDQRIEPAGLTETNQIQRIDETVVPTTFSDIRYYLLCPKNYQFRKQYGFNPHVPDLYGYGQTVHTAIGKLHELFPANSPSSAQTEEITREMFHLKHVPPSRDPVNSPGPYERARDKAVEIVTNYTQSYGHEFTSDRQIESRFEILTAAALITGIIDLLVRQDNGGNIIEATVVDFKSLEEPAEENELDWVELSIQVQLYAKAANEVLGENARTGAVHLLRNNRRVAVPITEESIEVATNNLIWAVNGILRRDYPMRPHLRKCEACDFRLLCSKAPQNFQVGEVPPAVYIPEEISTNRFLVKAFSEFSDTR